MNLELTIFKSASQQLNELPPLLRRSLILAIHRLSIEPQPADSRKIRGRDGYIILVNSFKILYRLDLARAKIIVVAIVQRFRDYAGITQKAKDRDSSVEQIVQVMAIDSYLLSVYRISKSSNFFSYDLVSVEDKIFIFVSPKTFITSDSAIDNAKNLLSFWRSSSFSA